MPLKLNPDLAWRDSGEESFSTLIGPMAWAFEPEPVARWYTRLTLEDRHLNLGGVCHGGLMMTLADNAMGSGAYMAGGRQPCATIEMSCQFLAGARKSETLVAVATLSKRTAEIAFLECEIWAIGRADGADRQVMAASGIWKYLSRYRKS